MSPVSGVLEYVCCLFFFSGEERGHQMVGMHRKHLGINMSYVYYVYSLESQCLIQNNNLILASLIHNLELHNIGRAMRKRVIGHMRTTRAQISLRIRVDRSGPLLSH